MEDFEGHLKKMILQTFSVHDLAGKISERFYHGFMIGLISGIDKNTYKIRSNRESGGGCYDIMLIAYDYDKLVIILELKAVDKEDCEKLKKLADVALQQIDERRYDVELRQERITQCLKIGIVFSGKDMAISDKKENLGPDVKLEIR